MRVLKLRTPFLAAVLSVMIEVLFFAAFLAFGTVTTFGDRTNIWSRSFLWFHQLAAAVTDFFVVMSSGSTWENVTGAVICFSIALLQWWILFFVGIWLVRSFHRKTA
jgi:hypothetical protein